MNLFKSKLREVKKKFKIPRILLLSGSVTLLLSLAIFLYISPNWHWADWTGLGADSNVSEEKTWENGKFKTFKSTKQFQSGKTLWDWFGLAGVIAIPIVLYQFQEQQQKKSEEQAEVEKKQVQKRLDVEREIAATYLREEALQNYVDKIAELLIDKRLKILLKQFFDGSITRDNPQLDAALDVARARTLSILRRLEGDGERKGSVIRFLIDAELIEGLELLKQGNLSKAHLSQVNLSKANLSEANLFRANLRFTQLSEANLFDADLSLANLSGADLSQANLYDGNLSGANLSLANLSGADFSGADLSGADLTLANLFGADFFRTDLSGAILKNIRNSDIEGSESLSPELIKEAIKEAINWEKAIYDPDFSELLELPPKNS